MWMVNPKTMCRQHLLGEHVECHMFVGTIKRGKSIKGYLDKGLLEIHNLQKRHQDLAQEMERRGYKHKSPLEFVTIIKSGKINRKENVIQLNNRCQKCKKMAGKEKRELH
jgi:hypothetical protein